MLKFYWNGIKDNGGKLQTCHYSNGLPINYPAGTITIYKRGYSGFTSGIRAAFTVENDSEMQTDYMVSDMFRVRPDHPLHVKVSLAWMAQQEHNAKRARKRAARCLAAHA